MPRTVRLPGRVGLAALTAAGFGVCSLGLAATSVGATGSPFGAFSAGPTAVESTSQTSTTTPVEPPVTSYTTSPTTTTTTSSPPTTTPPTTSSTTRRTPTLPPTTNTRTRTTPTWTPTPTPTDDGGGEDDSLTKEELERQLADAERLLAELRRSNAAIAASLARTDALAKQANDLLARLAASRDALEAATVEATRNEELFVTLEARRAAADQLLRDWAFYAYTEGGSIADFTGILDSLGSDPAVVGNPIGDLSYLTEERSLLQESIERLTIQQEEATEKARSARASIAAATVRMEADKKKLDASLKTQKDELARLRAGQSEELAQAGPLVSLLVGIQTPEAKAAYDELMAELGRAGQDLTKIGATCSNDEGIYPNGMLPASALCPLWQAPGEALRPRAAAGFNALSQAYAKATGAPICVTDSYRTLAEQYDVKRRRGGWAARPGTSPHGLGRAVDLCGGIGSFGTPQHLWMKQNAPLFGWYHPSWAGAGGSLPEPWHWEFAG